MWNFENDILFWKSFVYIKFKENWSSNWSLRNPKKRWLFYITSKRSAPQTDSCGTPNVSYSTLALFSNSCIYIQHEQKWSKNWSLWYPKHTYVLVKNLYIAFYLVLICVCNIRNLSYNKNIFLNSVDIVF